MKAISSFCLTNTVQADNRPTCCKLADSVQQLKLPGFFHIMDGVCNLAGGGLNIELQAEAINVSITCKAQSCFNKLEPPYEQASCARKPASGHLFLWPMVATTIHLLPTDFGSLCKSLPKVTSSKGSESPSETSMTFPFGLRISRKLCRSAGHFGPPFSAGFMR